MKNKLKGLYWFFKHSRRIILPLTKNGWITLLAVANSWSAGVPEEMQFGSWLALTGLEMTKPKTIKAALDLIDYQHEKTVNYLAGYCLFPKGERKLFDTKYSDVRMLRALGWKQTFEWRPVCG